MQDDQAQTLPFPGSPVVPQTFDNSKIIRFQCHPGISCCKNIDIALTPYDILRLKRRFATSSGEFLRHYTFPYEIVASDGFSDIYDLSAEALKDIRCDDLELMQFGFRFLRQVLFGEETIPLRKEAAEQRLDKLKNNNKQDLARGVDTINNGYDARKL